MPGSTPSRCLRNCHASLVPMSERQQLKLVRQLEIGDGQGGNSGCLKEPGPQRARSRSCNCRGETPLHKAAIKGDEELISKLLQGHADPNIPDFAGWTPLHEACNHGWYRVAVALIEAGASVNARGLDDDTPLHDAAVNGHTKLVRLLVERGADVNARNKVGKTPCDVAAPGLIQQLLSLHSSENVELVKKFDNGLPQESDSTAVSDTLQTTLQTKDDKNPKVTLKLQHLKKKSVGKSFTSQGPVCSNNRLQYSGTMEEKNSKEDVYEFKSSKEATPVRGTSVSPEVDKNSSEPKNEKSGEGNSAAETSESSSMKRALTEVAENDETEDETKRKKRKDGDGKVRDEAVASSKTLNSSGRTNTVRNVNNGSEKGGKVTGHTLCKNSGGASKSVISSSGVNVNSDRKSPGSPKGTVAPAQHLSANVPPNSVSKTESDQDDKSVGEGEKMDQGPKVPPLKIVIPQQTASEPEQGNRNGKNGNSRHHQALPYVVSSNSNDGEKEGLRSRSASPTDSFKSDEKKDPAIGMLSAEDQKGSLHHQRVLRSANRSGPNLNGDGRSVDASVSRIGGAGGQSSSSSSSNANATLSSTASNANGGVTIAPTDNPSPQSQSRSSPLPQVDPNSSVSATSVPPTSDGTAVIQGSSNYRASSTTPSKTIGGSSSATTTSNYDDKASESNSESSQMPSQAAASNPAPVELHPRKRKLKHNKEVKEPPLPQVTTERCESATTTEVHPHEQPVKNCYQLFLDIRKQIERRRKGLFPVQPKPPQGFKDYLMNRCTYVLAGNASTRQIPTSPLPQNLPSPMKDLFSEQEKERHRLRLQHVIEKEKLVLSVEQEILRVHGRAARALANQSLPFSACTILKDEEVYNLITPEQEEKDRNARSRYNGRLFLSWLQDVDDKWEKIKEAMLLRHHNEAESLHAVQKMDWEWKMKELGSCEFKSKPVILENHVPMVHVSDDFDLLPA